MCLRSGGEEVHVYEEEDTCVCVLEEKRYMYMGRRMHVSAFWRRRGTCIWIYISTHTHTHTHTPKTLYISIYI